MIIKGSPIKIEYVSSVISDKIIPVIEHCKEVASEKKLKRIIKTTGFESLSIADIDICTSDMCFQAAINILNNHKGGGINKNDIGALIFITQTADYQGPASAYILQNRLNLSKDIIAFDVNLGCSGFVYGLYLASSILSNLNDKKVMICCGDVASSSLKVTETSAGAILADAGACAIVSKNDNAESVLFNIESFGERWNALMHETFGHRHRKKVITDPAQYQSDMMNDLPTFMDGMAITDFTINDVPKNIEKLLNAANLSKDEIGTYLFHQAQGLLISSLAQKLNLSAEKVIFNSQHIGNTSSASIPCVMTEIGSAWNERTNKKVLMSGFGVGLSIASVIMNLDDTIFMETKKYERN